MANFQLHNGYLYAAFGSRRRVRMWQLPLRSGDLDEFASTMAEHRLELKVLQLQMDKLIG